MSVSSVSPEQRMVLTRSHCAGLSEAAARQTPFITLTLTLTLPYHHYSSQAQQAWLQSCRACTQDPVAMRRRARHSQATAAAR